ncbi:MAG: sacsin N-terminal ATP-binding-like domain-containing protein, partial [Pseudonocardiaceae bacterium]
MTRDLPADPFGTAALRDGVLAAWRGSPTRFREDANTESDLALLGYADRLLVELAQNAADAAQRMGEPGYLRVTIGEGELRAANTGAPLDSAGVVALAALRASAKREGSSVGRFGVGFAAVLGVTDEPRVVSRSGGVVFSAQRTAAAVAGDPALRAELQRRGGRPPVLRLVWPAGGDPPPGFDTEVRLPLRPGT